ncbi:MAG: nuclear transport factor 2 family protein [Ignavibacteriales bacterium]
MKNPEEILKAWLQAVNNRDIENLLAFYNKSAILIPTFSNRILNSSAKIRDYFEKLNMNKELHVTLHENTVKVQEIAENIYALCGIYLWQMAVEEEALSFEARFSFVLDLRQHDPIIQHHSSQIPRML